MAGRLPCNGTRPKRSVTGPTQDAKDGSMKRTITMLILVAMAASMVSAQTMKIVGTEWPPYQMTGADGKVTGFATELILAVLDSMGIKATIELVPWERAIKMVTDGDADAIYSLSYKTDRAVFLYYPTIALHASSYRFFVRKEDAGRISYVDWKDLAPYAMGMTAGYAYTADFVEFMKTKGKPQEADTDATAFRMLSGKRIDVFPCDLANGIAVLKELGLYDKIVPLPGTPLTTKDYFIGFSKKAKFAGIADFAARFDAAFTAFKKTPAYQAIVQKYEG